MQMTPSLSPGRLLRRFHRCRCRHPNPSLVRRCPSETARGRCGAPTSELACLETRLSSAREAHTLSATGEALKSPRNATLSTWACALPVNCARAVLRIRLGAMRAPHRSRTPLDGCAISLALSPGTGLATPPWCGPDRDPANRNRRRGVRLPSAALAEPSRWRSYRGGYVGYCGGSAETAPLDPPR